MISGSLLGLLAMPQVACTDAVALGALTASAPVDAGEPAVRRLTATYVKPRRVETATNFGAAVAYIDTDLVVGAAGSGDCGGATPDLLCIDEGAATFMTTPLDGQTIYGILKAQDASEDDGFGRSLASSDSWLIVGAPDKAIEAEGDKLSNAGAVYPFRRVANGFERDDRWVSTTPERRGYFGTSVALDEGWAAVLFAGATCGVDCPKRGVEIYRLVSGRWERFQTVEIAGDGPPLNERLRGQVVLRDDLLVIGLPTDDPCSESGEEPCPDAGTVRVLGWDGGSWQPQPALPGEEAAFFGAAVDVDGGRLFVGAPGEGVVHIFERTDGQWRRTARLTIAEAVWSEFGAALDAHGDELLVGAPKDRDCRVGVDPAPGWDDRCVADGVGPGAAFLYRRDESGEWNLTHHFKPTHDRAQTSFGSAVLLRPDLVAIGAPGDPFHLEGIDAPLGSEGLTNVGAVFVYARGS